MKQSKIIVVFLLCVLVLSSCSLFSSSPSDAIKNLSYQIKNKNAEKAAELFSNNFLNKRFGGKEESVKSLKRSFEAGRGNEIPPETSFEIEKEEIISDRAVVTTKYISQNGNVANKKYTLIKEDGQWKIDSIE